MVKLIFILFVSAICATAFSQANLITITNNSGKVLRDLAVVKIEHDGVLFRLPDGAGWDRVKFTNMPESLWPQFGYDPEKQRKADADRVAADKAARDAEIARKKALQYHAVDAHRYLISPITESDFPKTEKAEAACREITAELKGMDKALEIGLNYLKFSDLLTEKAIAVEKVKDLRGEGIPQDFLRRVDDCIDAYNQSRDWWKKKIEADVAGEKPFEDFVMREYWSTAALHLTYCLGIAEKNTNANSAAILRVAEIIKTEQTDIKEGYLKWPERFDPEVANLSTEQIAERLRKSSSTTNSP